MFSGSPSNRSIFSRARSAAHELTMRFDCEATLSLRDKALMESIGRNDLDGVRAALRQRAWIGVPWLWKGRERGEAIHFAVHQAIRNNGDLRILDTLLAAGANPTTPDARGRSPEKFLEQVDRRYANPLLTERIGRIKAVLSGDRQAAWPPMVTEKTAQRHAMAPY